MHVAKLGLAVALGWMMAGTVLARDVPTTAGTPQVTLTPEGEYRRQISDAGKLFENGDFAGANKALKALLSDKRFAALNAKQQLGALLYGAASAFYQDETARSRELFERSARIAPTSYASYMLAVINLLDGKGDVAARHLAAGVRDDLKQLSDYHDALVPETLRSATPDSPERLELMQALLDSGWDQNGLGASSVWFELAEARLRQGRAEDAKAVIARIDGAMALVRLRTDKRFDALVASLPNLPAPEAAAKARVERLRALVAQQPKRLDALNSLIGALLMVGEWQEGLRLTDEALARVKNAPVDEPAFDDESHLSWLKDRRSRLLLVAGRTDEALDELKVAAAMPEDEHPNVSQVLNLGHLYCQLGRPDEALAAIRDVGKDISGYGQVVEATVKLWAATQKKDARGVARALRDLREHRADGEEPYLDALVISGRLDEAAAELALQLDDPLLRAGVLVQVQHFRELEALPGEVEYRRNWRDMLAREDVRAAIQKVGRIETFAIYASWDDD